MLAWPTRLEHPPSGLRALSTIHGQLEEDGHEQAELGLQTARQVAGISQLQLGYVAEV